MMLGKLLRNERRHTIVSRETIKPSSPTPSHLKTYNLSLLDQTTHRDYISLLFYYPNYGGSRLAALNPRERSCELKKSLSQTLTKYYPFAGRFASGGAYVDCNDEGVCFLEADSDASLNDFMHISPYENQAQLLPCSRSWDGLHDKATSLVAVHVNHFICGGIALAVSVSHKLGDASTLANFILHWASVTRLVEPVNPHFMMMPSMKYEAPEYLLENTDDCITKSFMFPNSKILELKSKVQAMATGKNLQIGNPTRVEVITSLLYKCAVEAAARNSGSFKRSTLAQPCNMRSKLLNPLPDTCVGNIALLLLVPTRDESEIALDMLTFHIQKKKMQLQGVRDYQGMIEILPEIFGNIFESSSNEMYICSSGCGIAFYDSDFGWGKPVNVTMPGLPRKNSFLLSETRDGIEALVNLEKQNMGAFEKDGNLLAYCYGMSRI